MLNIWRTNYLPSLLPIALLLAINVYALGGMKELTSLAQPATPFPCFTTQDLYGHTVTADIFKGNFSVVYLWVTKDSDVSQNLLTVMKELAPETTRPIRLIGIVGDAKAGEDSQIFLARKLTEDLPEDAVQLLPNDDLLPFLQNIHSAPFVCFVDEEGNFCGQPVVGNEPELIKQELKRLTKAGSRGSESAAMVQERLCGRP
ncbi:MAG: hypothetical protein IJ849_04360 [Selenomonadaceae bacterium]|nr:hypothetical protein [Selenomonadaceae bacterium]